MSFRFKLEALQRYRHFKEENLQRELSDLQRHRDEEEERLKRVLERRRQTEADFAELQGNPDFGAYFNLYCCYLESLARQVAAAQRALSEAQKACADKIAELLGAVKDRKILDKLKEKQLSEHLWQLSRDEQTFINEMAVNRFNLNQRS